MSDFNDELYNERKSYWVKRFRGLEAELGDYSVEEWDAFVNASQDFLDDD